MNVDFRLPVDIVQCDEFVVVVHVGVAGIRKTSAEGDAVVNAFGIRTASHGNRFGIGITGYFLIRLQQYGYQIGIHREEQRFSGSVNRNGT